MLTLRQIRYFDALATTRHFGRAAALVSVSQPALSTQIMEMEEHLGTRLVERNRSGALLTEKGESVHAQIKVILACIDHLEQSARSERGTLTGTVRIGIIPTLAPYLVPTLVPKLRSAYPEIDIELRETLTDRLVADLLDGRLDAIVVALPVEAEGTQAQPLFSDRFFMAMADNDRQVLMSPLTEDQVDVERLLLLEEGHCLRDQALAVCSTVGRRSLVNFGATSMATLLQMVSHGMGMTLIPEIAVPTEAARNALRIVPFAEPQPAREIGLVWRRSSSRRDDMAALADAIVASRRDIEALVGSPPPQLATGSLSGRGGTASATEDGGGSAG
ncbi:hydrogen peroxide-inducible genes activator [Ensifer soli]|uniref:hydrogen peroxide-inducible genes activator n=1 Tax=Ciceribacter sp. sgz301302 TaxID=3342379 RepID=UPI0035B9AE45